MSARKKKQQTYQYFLKYIVILIEYLDASENIYTIFCFELSITLKPHTSQDRRTLKGNRKKNHSHYKYKMKLAGCNNEMPFSLHVYSSLKRNER